MPTICWFSCYMYILCTCTLILYTVHVHVQSTCKYMYMYNVCPHYDHCIHMYSLHCSLPHNVHVRVRGKEEPCLFTSLQCLYHYHFRLPELYLSIMPARTTTAQPRACPSPTETSCTFSTLEMTNGGRPLWWVTMPKMDHRASFPARTGTCIIVVCCILYLYMYMHIYTPSRHL